MSTNFGNAIVTEIYDQIIDLYRRRARKLSFI